MSFSKTVSVCAALASIFAAGAAGWKLANENQTKPAEEVNQKYEEHITDLQKKISELEQKTINPVVVTPTQVPQQTSLPPLPPVPEPKPGEFE
jgi:predicted negative regulator of RcsB-dependent stress response